MTLFTFALLALLFPGLYGAADTGVRLSTGVGKVRLVVPDHGFVRHNQIDNFYREIPRDMFLVGITSFSSCCSRNYTTDGKEIGWWFYPNGTEIPKIQEQFQWRFFTSRYKQKIFLYRRRGGANGIHRLDIPVSAARNETFYVGLYLNADLGNPRVTLMQFNLASEYTVGETSKFSVTCNSEGGPATTVTWTRDEVAVSGGNFTATRRLDDPVTAAYTLTLSVTGRQGGVYRCQVSKSGPGMSGDPVKSSMELEVKVASPPTDFTAEQVNETTVRISWTPPTSKESVTGYQIYYMEVESQGTRGEFMTVPETNHKLIHELQTGINYSFTMVALSEHLPSEVVGSIPLIIKAVPAVPMVTTMEVTTSSVWLQWLQQSDVNNVNQPDSLQIAFQYTMGSLHNGFCSDYQYSDNVTLTNGSIQQYNITGLQEHSTYSITIVAVNAAGKSAPSEVVIITLQAAPSGTPQGVTRVNTTSTNITLQWREVPCIDRNGDIIGYTVRYSISGSNNTILHSASDKLAATLVELIPFANYSIEVAAVNVNGTGPFSTPVYLRTDGDTPSGTPQEVTVMADTTSTKITVQWREVPYFNRNGDIVGYTVRYHSISGCSSATLHSETETLAATLVELIPFTNYSIEVAAVNVNGTGPFSTPVYLRTDGDTPSGTPQEVTIGDTTSTKITLQWREVPCIDRNGDIIGYTVRYSISGINITLRHYSDTVATLVELIPFTNYSIEVAAFNVNGTGPFSTPVYMRTDSDIAYYAEVRLYTGVNEQRPLVPDHGFIRHSQIDDYYPDSPKQVFLAGITTFNSCCSGYFTNGKERGWWFYPNGTEIPKYQDHFQWSFFTSRHQRIVFLYRRGGGASGIHRLDIPVSTAVNMTFYVGLYPSEDSGNPNVTSMRFNLTSQYTVKFSVTCSSVGGPATNVTWTRDGDAVSGGNFTATRRLDDPVTAAYTLTLSVTGRQGGVYRCQVAKSGPGVSGDPVNSSMELEVKVANPPTGLIAVKEDETKVKVSWTPPTGGDTVTGYQIFYQHSNSVIVNASVTQYVIVDPEPNITHPITMVALSEHLPSEVVGPVTPIRSTEMKPHAITVTTVEVTTTSVWLRWSEVNTVNQPDSIQIAFQYTMGSLHNGFCSDYQHSDIVTLANGSTHQYNITGLQEHSIYNITIIAENAASKSAPSEVVITTLQAAPSGTPQGVTRVNTTSTEITLQWREVPCIDRNGDIVGYTVCYSISGSNNTILRSASDKLAVTLVDLIPFANYSIEVAAVNVNGTGPFSTPVYMRTDDDKPPEDSTPIIIGAVFSVIAAAIIIMILTIVGVAKHRVPKVTLLQDVRDAAAKTECVALERAAHDEPGICV